MAQITAALVKELRTKSGAGMMDCKKALAETDGDLDGAVDWLRKKGLSSAAKKAGRVAAQGLVSVRTVGNKGAAVELNSETDFVARNEQFQKFVTDISNIALETGVDVEALKSAAYPETGKNVSEQLTDMIATIGENMNLRRTTSLSVDKGVVASYIHTAVADGLGKIGVMVALESEGDAAKLQEVGKQVAMHVAATNPQFLSIDSVNPDALARERAVLVDQARDSGKPENIIEKMVDGRIRKYYEECVLLEQVFVMDTDKKVKQVVEAAAKELGTDVKLTGYVRYELGEGIEKKEDDFAAEVAAQAGK
ncbi:MAG: elongation factor Ts [Alphaproteobacteria bacterium]|nr:elongation factor Ts [Alphaproteobacteria bacterium]